MKRNVVFIEVEGGSDKGPDGHRRDTMPMVEALWKRGWSASVIFYDPNRRFEIFKDILDRADAYVSRVNPGTIPGGEKDYLEMLRYLSAAGLDGFSDADMMISMGAKDALAKLAGSSIVPEDTFAYFDMESFTRNFPVTLSMGDRVLKQNRGSTGEGIWHVLLADEREFPVGEALPLDAKIKCVEAVDNHVEYHELGDFMKFCEQYIVGEDGELVDMRFLRRIKEGEIRILMVADHPIFVVHKKPAEGDDAFSATLFSGAKYTYDSPEKWPKLIDVFLRSLPEIKKTFNLKHLPILWTSDFILDDAYDDDEHFVLGEMNCSCVGFTSHLDLGIQETVAESIIDALTHPEHAA